VVPFNEYLTSPMEHNGKIHSREGVHPQKACKRTPGNEILPWKRVKLCDARGLAGHACRLQRSCLSATATECSQGGSEDVSHVSKKQAVPLDVSMHNLRFFNALL